MIQTRLECFLRLSPSLGLVLNVSLSLQFCCLLKMLFDVRPLGVVGMDLGGSDEFATIYDLTTDGICSLQFD